MVQVDQLLQHPHIWRARHLGQAQAWYKGISSGYNTLDQHLADGGWPRGGLAECLLDTYGIGELRLLTPALRHLEHSDQRWQAWILPPFIPYAPALAASGLNLRRLLIIQPSCLEDTLWAIERVCQSGACSSVLAWLDDNRLTVKHTQRLRLAVQQGQTFACLFRPLRAANQSSLAELRLALRPTNSAAELQVDILKRRAGWPVHGLRLNISQECQPTFCSTQQMHQLLTEWRSAKAPLPASSPARITHAN